MNEEQKVCDLTDVEAAAFRRIQICRMAVEQVVHSAVREWETAMMATDELWSVLAKRYGLDLITQEYTSIGGAIYKKGPLAWRDDQKDRARQYVGGLLRTIMSETKGEKEP